jgi:hypothetical protein
LRLIRGNDLNQYNIFFTVVVVVKVQVSHLVGDAADNAAVEIGALFGALLPCFDIATRQGFFS